MTTTYPGYDIEHGGDLLTQATAVFDPSGRVASPLPDSAVPCRVPRSTPPTREGPPMPTQLALLLVNTGTMVCGLVIGYLVAILTVIRPRVGRELAAWHRWLTITRHDPLQARQTVLDDLAVRVEHLTGTRL